MLIWRLVQAAAARIVRTCSYDWAGLGYSDPGRRASSDEKIVDDLHALQLAAALDTPVLFVGHSLGGEIGLLYNALYPADITGALLVEPSMPDLLHVLQRNLPLIDRETVKRGVFKILERDRACPALAEKGRLSWPETTIEKQCVDTAGSPDRLEPALQRASARQLAKAATWRALVSETESLLPELNERSVNDRRFGPKADANASRLTTHARGRGSAAGAFERSFDPGRDVQQPRIAATLTDELHADRHPGRADVAGQRDTRGMQRRERAVERRRPGAGQSDRRLAGRGGGEHDVVVVEHGVELDAATLRQPAAGAVSFGAAGLAIRDPAIAQIRTYPLPMEALFPGQGARTFIRGDPADRVAEQPELRRQFQRAHRSAGATGGCLP